MAVSRLIVMRHAESDWCGSRLEDFSRPLSSRGMCDARRAGQWLAAETLFPQWVVSSPARRARDTLKFVGEGAGVDFQPRINFVDDLYNCSLDNILTVLAANKRRRELMVMAHNPGLGELIDYLVADGSQENGLSMGFPAGAVFILETATRFDALNLGCAHITACQQPKALPD